MMRNAYIFFKISSMKVSVHCFPKWLRQSIDGLSTGAELNVRFIYMPMQLSCLCFISVVLVVSLAAWFIHCLACSISILIRFLSLCL